MCCTCKRATPEAASAHSSTQHAFTKVRHSATLSAEHECAYTHHHRPLSVRPSAGLEGGRAQAIVRDKVRDKV